MFADRVDAGARIARALGRYRSQRDTVVMGIPRGGVVVAAQVSRELQLPLDVALAAKVGAPGNPEYAIGAVAEDGFVIANPDSGFTTESVGTLAGPAREKIAAESGLFRAGRLALDPEGQTVLLIDDGLATGLTAMAAADWLKRQGAARVVIAAPVAPPDTVEALRSHADDVVVVEAPAYFGAVGRFYERFDQTDDAEVLALLEASSGKLFHGDVAEGGRPSS